GLLLASYSSVGASFTNRATIAIPDLGNGSPYPSTIYVSGLLGTITRVTVTLNQLTHTYPDDIDVLLVAPDGQKSLLMSSVGGVTPVTGITLTLDDAATVSLPQSGRLVTGTFKP